MKNKEKSRVKVVDEFIAQHFKGGLAVRYLAQAGLLGDASVLHLVLPRRSVLPNVRHNRTTEIIYCVDGSMTAYLGAKTHPIRAGHVIYIPKGIWHKFTTQSKSCEVLAFFHPELIIKRGADIETEAGVNLFY